MSAIKIACPACALVLNTAQPVPAGQMIKCPKCTKVFAVPRAAEPQATKPRAAKPQASVTKPQIVAKPQATAPSKVSCPGCRLVLVTPTPLPADRRIKCWRCRMVFGVPPVPQPGSKEVVKPPPTPTVQVPAAPTAAKVPTTPDLPKPVVAKPTKVERPVIRISCPSCALVLKTSNPPPAGTVIKCPKCAKPFKFGSAKATKLAAEQPKPTQLAPAVKSQAAKPTTLAPGGKNIIKPTMLAAPQVKPTKLAAQQAKPTKLAQPGKPQAAKPTTLGPVAKPTKLAGDPSAAKPRVARVIRLRCPKCASPLMCPTPLPVGRTLRCPKCKAGFQAHARKKGAPAPVIAVKKASDSRVKPTKPQVVVAKRNTTLAPPPPPARRSRRKPVVLAALLILVAGLSVGAYFAWDTVTSDFPASEWQDFAPADGRCILRVPGPPVAESGSGHGEGVINARKYTVLRDDEGAAFLLTWSDRIAGASLNSLYVSERDYVLEKMSARLIQENDIDLDGSAGKEFQAEVAKVGLVIGRIYLIKGKPYDRLFVLVAGAPALRPGKGAASKFFDSFKIMPPPAADPPRKPKSERGRIRPA